MYVLGQAESPEVQGDSSSGDPLGFDYSFPVKALVFGLAAWWLIFKK